MTFRFDLFAIGSWTLFDHIFKMSKYPSKGETVPLNMPIERIDTVYFGDCSANVAAVAAKLGLRVGLGMVVGDDFIKSGFQKHLNDLGVDITGVEVKKGERSGHTYIFFDQLGNAFYLSHLGIAQGQSTWEVPHELIMSSRCLVINEMYSDYTLSAIKMAKSKGILTAINGMVGTAGAKARAFIEQTDILFISEDELKLLLSVLELQDVKELQSIGPKRIFATYGSKGSRIYLPDSVYEVGVVPANEVVDPIGAGDAYSAGVLSALLKGIPEVYAARVGATVSSFVIEAWGCQTNLPDWSMVRSRYKTNFNEEI